jgi:hypothetical protein
MRAQTRMSVLSCNVTATIWRISHPHAHEPDPRLLPHPRRQVRIRYPSRSAARRARFASSISRTAMTCACCRAKANTSFTKLASTLGFSSCPARVRSAGMVSSKHANVFVKRVSIFFQISKRWRLYWQEESRQSGAPRNNHASRDTCALRDAGTDTEWRTKTQQILRTRWLSPNSQPQDQKSFFFSRTVEFYRRTAFFFALSMCIGCCVFFFLHVLELLPNTHFFYN